MTVGRYIMRWRVFQGRSFATRALANSGEGVEPVAIETARHTLFGTATQRHVLNATAITRHSLNATATTRHALSGGTP